MRRTPLIAGVLGAGAIGASLALRRVDARWSGADDPCAPADRALPGGDSSVVTTDDGAELAVTVAGSGPTVVLAHGWTNGREIWAPVAHRLIRGGRTVVLYDQRGHGSSTVGDDGFTVPRLGGDLAAVLEAIDVRDAILGGHSMGGMTIQSLTTHHPEVVAERAKALVLVSTAASGLSQGRRDARAAKLVGGVGVERALRSRFGHALVRGTVGAAVHRNHLVLTRDLFVACPPATRSGWLTAMQTMDLREGIARIGIPTTIVVGSADRLTPPDRAAELADTIPGAELVTLDGYGHMLPLEAPDEVATALAKAG